MYSLTFLGSGSAFYVGDRIGENYQSNMLLEAAGPEATKRLLIDCGTDIRFSLHEKGLKLADLTDIYISHLHADHCGGLEGVAFSTKFNPNCPPPNIYISRMFANELWASTLRGGLKSIEGEATDMSSFFNVRAVGRSGNFSWCGLDLQLIQVVHVMDGFSINPSFGLFFKADNTQVFITTDTQFAPNQIMKFYEMADVIFQDCETAPFQSGVHAHYDQLKTLPDKVKAKMWLYHYQPGPLPDAMADGFCGFVTKGQKFAFADGQCTTEPAAGPQE